VPVEDVSSCFEELVEAMPPHPHMDELLNYFEHSYIKGRRLAGRRQQYRPAIFPPESWNQRQSAVDGISRTTNIAEGWHHSLHSLFLCDHPSMWVFLDGLKKDMTLQKAGFLQGIAGSQRRPKHTYVQLKQRVQGAVDNYRKTDTVTYLRAIAHLYYS